MPHLRERQDLIFFLWAPEFTGPCREQHLLVTYCSLWEPSYSPIVCQEKTVILFHGKDTILEVFYSLKTIFFSSPQILHTTSIFSFCNPLMEASGQTNLPNSALTISFFNLTYCVGIFIFRLTHNTGELTMFYHVDPVHPGLTGGLCSCCMKYRQCHGNRNRQQRITRDAGSHHCAHHLLLKLFNL